MTIAPDSALATLWCPAPNREPRRNSRGADMLVLHYTGIESAEAALDWLTRGKVEGLLPLSLASMRTGASPRWCASRNAPGMPGRACGPEADLNSCSIGIEESADAEHARPVADAQVPAVEACLNMFLMYSPSGCALDIHAGRKRDPGEKFDWARLARAGVGLGSRRRRLAGVSGLGPGDEGPDVLKLQQDLAAFGYGVELTSTYGTGLEKVVEAFQRHFRQERLDGYADASTRDTLGRLHRGATGLAGGVADNPALMRELALGHHEMMHLMVRALHHDAHEAERLELRHLRRVVAR